MINNVFENKKGKKNSSDGKVFISYSKSKPEYADYIELLLVQRNITVIRDQTFIELGGDVQRSIIDAVNDCTIFIVTWCAEYACSPWCYDEIHQALERHRNGEIDIWIFNIDGTRISPKGARDLLYYDVKSREDLGNKLLALLNTYRMPKVSHFETR